MEFESVIYICENVFSLLNFNVDKGSTAYLQHEGYHQNSYEKYGCLKKLKI